MTRTTAVVLKAGHPGLETSFKRAALQMVSASASCFGPIENISGQGLDLSSSS